MLLPVGWCPDLPGRGALLRASLSHIRILSQLVKVAVKFFVR
jgi:hypothetical protein